MQPEKSKEQQSGQDDFSQMLEDKRMGNELLRKPAHGLPDQKPRRIREVLSHANVKRPGRDTFASNVTRKLNKVRVITVNRIASDILIQEDQSVE